MRILLLSSFLLLISCSPISKNLYMCGDRECVDKKEAKEYFEKHLTMEVRITDKKKGKNVDLVKLNTNSIKQNKSIKSKSIDKNKLLELKRKEELKKQKKLAKILVKEERKKIKQEKKALKLKKRNEKKPIVQLKKEKKIKKNVKQKIKENKFCIILENCDIDEISTYLIKIGKEKDYPDITKY